MYGGGFDGAAKGPAGENREGGAEIFVLVCEHFLPEAERAVTQLELEKVRCGSFPARCGRPPLARHELPSGGDCGRTLILGGACLSRLDSASRSVRHSALVQTTQCFEMLAGQTFVETQLRQGAFLATPGWLARWKEWMEANGFDQATAAEFFRESVTGIVMLDTGTDAASGRNLADFSSFVDLPALRVPVGIDVFKIFLHRLILIEKQKLSRQLTAAREQAHKQEQADFAMALDLLSELPKASSESEAFSKTRSVLDMLFAPRQIVYTEIEAGKPPKSRVLAGDPEKIDLTRICRRMADNLQNSRLVRSENGFVLRMASRENVFRGLEIGNLAFPEYMDRYVQIARAIADVCSLAIDNARSYQKLKESEMRLREIATTDGLTGVDNRAHFMEKAEREVCRSGRYEGKFTLMLMDVDHFKQINDNHGHPAGDAVLRRIASLCSQAMRGSDLFGRIGGEEFAAGLVETDLSSGIAAAERIRKAIASHRFERGAEGIRCTASFGVTAFAGKGDSLEDMLKRADIALYRAKNRGRDRVVTMPGPGGGEYSRQNGS
jgi:diguanylate cyclase (GGDEF)-like protein